MTRNYQIVILGGGTGGYIAAVRAAQLGKTVAVVEKDKLGGTCLHRGCIPSKSLLRSAEVYHDIQNSDTYGVKVSDVKLDFGRVQNRKQGIIDQMHKGVEYLMKKNKIDVFYGLGRIVPPSIFSPRSGSIAVELPNGEAETLVSEHLILATGSRPRSLPEIAIDGTYVMTSDEALQMESLPSSILIIGGGVIGVEWASMLHDYGVDVTIVEYEERLVPLEDRDISKELERLFKKRGVKIMTGAKVLSETVHIEQNGVILQAEYRGETVKLQADKVLVSVGRQANVEDIGLENTDIKMERGVVKVNEFMQTAEPHIYAIGDMNGGLQLAHVAGHEGIAAVEHICGHHVEPYAMHLISRCIYTRPEIASVGWTEQQAADKGYNIKVGKFPFKAIGKALVFGDADGFVKVVADKDTKDILGVHMIGPHVTDLISEASLAQILNATPWEVGQTIHPHPTLSEAIGEAMLAVDGQAIGM